MATLLVLINALGAKQGAVQFTAAVGQIQSAAFAGTKSVAALDASMVALNRTTTAVGASFAAAFAILAAGTTLKGAVSTIAQLGQELTIVQAISRATTIEFKDLSQAARDIGGSAVFGAVEAAKALRILAQAGFSAQESTSALAGTLRLAQIGELDLASATDIAASAVRQFRLGASDVDRIVDALAVTANKTTTTVRALSEALKFVGPTASFVGTSIEETAALLGVLANRGLEGTLAGTAIRQTLVSLIDPTREAAKEIERLGLKLADVNPARVGAIKAFENLAKAQLDVESAAKIFTQRGINTALILTTQLDAVNELTEGIKRNAGESERLSNIFNQTLIGSTKRLGSAIGELFIQLGEAGLEKALVNTVNTLRLAVLQIAGVKEGFEKTTRAVETVRAVLEGGAGFLVAASAIKVTIAALGVLRAALLSNPITVLPTILAGAAAALVIFRDEMVNVGFGVGRVGDQVKIVFDVLSERVVFLFKKLKPVVIETLAALGDAVTVAFSAIGETLKRFADFTVGLFDAIFGTESGGVSSIKRFANFTIAVFKSIGDVILEFGKGVAIAFRAITDFDFTSPIESFKKLNEAFSADNLNSALEQFGAKLKENFKTDFVQIFKETGQNAQDALIEGFRGNDVGQAVREFFAVGDEIEEALATVNFLRSPAGQAVIDQGRQLGVETAFSLIAGFQVTLDGMQPVKPPKILPPEIPPPLFNEDRVRETDLLAKANDEIAKRIKFIQVELGLRQAGVRFDRETVDLEILYEQALEAGNTELAKRIDQLNVLRVKQEEAEAAAEGFREAQDLLARTFTDAFASIIDGSKSAKEAFRDLAKTIVQEITRIALLKAFTQLFGAGGLGAGVTGAVGTIIQPVPGSAMGNVFSGGRLIPFQRGGVVDSPTFFPLAGGVGLAGEAGTEGIFPLARTSGGRLGVESVGGSSRTYNITQNISTPDANSFRRSRKQVQQDLGVSVRRLP